MAYLSLYRKYRPRTFDEVLGQEAVTKTLANAVVEDRVSHAYLFTGPRGTGKTSTARILAKALNCAEGPTPTPCGRCRSCVAIAEGSSLDLIEMDAASHSKVDETREILAGVPLATAGGRRKVYVIDEVHMLSTGSFNALLKTLEEPPGHVLFVLATTEAHKVLPTIVSRTQRFDFRRITSDVLQKHLARVAEAEGMDVEPQALEVIARHADGSARDALSVLDQLSSFAGPVDADQVERLLGERREEALLALFDAIAAEEIGGVFEVVQSLVGQGTDIRQLALASLGHARTLLLLKSAPESGDLVDASIDDRPRLSEQAGRFSGAHLLRVLDLLSKALIEMRNVPNHRLLLEVALVRAAAPETDPSATGLLGRIERLERRVSIEPSAAPPRRATEQATPAAAARVERTMVEQEAASARPATTEDGDEHPDAEGSVLESAAAAPDPVPPDHIGVNHLREAWPATLKEVNKRSKRVWGLLNPSRPVTYEEGRLVVEVQSEFHRSTMSDERNLQLLADSLHAALGVRPALAFAAAGASSAGASSAGGSTTSSGSTAPATATTSTHTQAEEAADYADAKPIEERSDDPIELVKKGLAAEVVEERDSRR